MKAVGIEKKLKQETSFCAGPESNPNTAYQCKFNSRPWHVRTVFVGCTRHRLTSRLYPPPGLLYMVVYTLSTMTIGSVMADAMVYAKGGKNLHALGGDHFTSTNQDVKHFKPLTL